MTSRSRPCNLVGGTRVSGSAKTSPRRCSAPQGSRPTASIRSSWGPDFGNIHGLNEYVSVKSLMQAREFLYRLIKTYSEQNEPRKG
jgi:hypothetical protein